MDYEKMWKELKSKVETEISQGVKDPESFDIKDSLRLVVSTMALNTINAIENKYKKESSDVK